MWRCPCGVSGRSERSRLRHERGDTMCQHRETETYVPASSVKALVEALEEIVQLGTNYAEGNFRYPHQHVAIARRALSDLPKEEGRDDA
jgi:hypothetical protein